MIHSVSVSMAAEKIFSQKAGIKFVNTKTSHSNDVEEKLCPISAQIWDKNRMYSQRETFA